MSNLTFLWYRDYMPYKSFYEGAPVNIPAYFRTATKSGTYEHEFVLPTVYASLEEEAINRKLEELNKTCRIIEHGGYRFDIGTLNDADSQTYQSFCSTAGSSIAGGKPSPSNAYEFATGAAANPTQPMVYVSSFGNGTSQLRGRSATFFMNTGRMTWEGAQDYRSQGIYAITCLAHALIKEGIIVSKPTGDSLGSIMASALSVELGRLGHTVTHAFLDKVPRLTGNTWFGMARTIRRDRQDEVARLQSATPDRLSVIFGGAQHERQIAGRVKRLMPNVYSRGLEQATGRIAWVAGLAGKLAVAGIGCSHGPGSLEADTNAFFAINPDAHLTVVFPTEDYLNQVGDHRMHIERYMDKIVIPGNGSLEALTPAVSHIYSKEMPTLRRAMETRALSMRSHR